MEENLNETNGYDSMEYENESQYTVIVVDIPEDNYTLQLISDERQILEDGYIDWGDGSNSNISAPVTSSHVYTNAGRYIIKGKFTFGTTAPSDSMKACLKEVRQFSDLGTIELNNAFNYCQFVQKINLKGVNSINVTDMTCMFYRCYELIDLDLSSLKTDNVTHMVHMFSGCKKLESFDISHFNTEKLLDMTYMFGNPSAGEGVIGPIIGIEDFDVSNVTNMTGAFSQTQLTSLDLSKWDTKNVTNMRELFNACSLLTSININNWNTSKVGNMSNMFNNCNNLKSLNLNHFDTSNVTNMHRMFKFCDSLTTLDISNFNTDNVTDMSYMFYDCRSLTILDISNFDTKDVTDMSYMFSNCNNLSNVLINNSDYNSVNKIIAQLPTRASNSRGVLTTAGIDNYSRVNTSTANSKYWNIKDKYLVARYTANASGVLPIFNNEYTYEVLETVNEGIYTVEIYANEDFTSCTFFDSFDTKFDSLLSVEYLKITNKVTSLRNLFNDCDNLVSVNTQGWDTSNVTDMCYMFWFSEALQEIDVSGFDTRNVVGMVGVFGSTDTKMNLKRIIGLENWDTSKVNEMSVMFQRCPKLESLDGIANWDVRKVSTFAGMFRDCDSITSLDLSNWRVPLANNMEQMFYSLDKLTTLNISNWTMDQVTKYDYLIGSCDSIKTIIMHNSNAVSVNKVIERLGYYENGLVLEVDGIDNIDDVNLSTANTKNISIKYNGEIIVLNDIAMYVVDIDTPGEIYVPTFNEGFKCEIGIATSTDVFDGRWANGSIDISNGQEIPAPNNNYSRTDFIKARPGVPCGIYSTEGGCLFFYDTNKNFISSQVVGEEGYASCLTQENFRYIRGIKKNGENDFAYGMIENIAVVSLVSKDLPTKISFENSEALEYVYYLNMSEVNTMNNMFKNCINFKAIKDYTEIERMIWGPELPLRDFNTHNVTDMSSALHGCSSLKSLDVSNFNTSNVTTMGWMFWGCGLLTTLDVSNWDTSNVTDMSYMFSNCLQLTSLDLNKWDTSNVTSMNFMFDQCCGLTSLDVSNFDTSNVTSMNKMFHYCKLLTSIDVSSFDTSNVTNMNHMFRYCQSLTSLNLSSFRLDKCTTMSEMFICCYNLTSLDISNFNISNATNINNMFYFCQSLTSITMGDSDYNSVNKVIGQLPTRASDSMGTLNIGGIDDINQVDITTAESKYWNIDNTGNKNLVAQYKFDKSIYKNLIPVFNTEFTDYEIVDEYLDTEDIEAHKTFYASNIVTRSLYSNELPTSMRFGINSGQGEPQCLCLLEVKYLNTDNLSTCASMFDWCENVINIHTANWNTSNVTDMNSMFDGCKNLTTLDLSNLDTGNVTDMSYMFDRCNNLTSLDLSNFNTNEVTDMSDMFYDCTNLTQLNISNFDTNNVTNMYSMFSGCESLASLDVSNFNTSNVQYMGYMFQYCKSLTQLNLSNFDTSNVTDMQSMFRDCIALKTLNLSNWKINNEADITKILSLDYESEMTIDKIEMNDSDYNSINKIIEQLPTKTVDFMGTLLIRRVDDITRVNIATAESKFWDIKDYISMFLEVSSIMKSDSNKKYSQFKLGNKTIRIVIPYKK